MNLRKGKRQKEQEERRNIMNINYEVKAPIKNNREASNITQEVRMLTLDLSEDTVKHGSSLKLLLPNNNCLVIKSYIHPYDMIMQIVWNGRESINKLIHLVAESKRSFELQIALSPRQRLKDNYLIPEEQTGTWYGQFLDVVVKNYSYHLSKEYEENLVNGLEGVNENTLSNDKETEPTIRNGELSYFFSDFPNRETKDVSDFLLACF